MNPRGVQTESSRPCDGSGTGRVTGRDLGGKTNNLSPLTANRSDDTYAAYLDSMLDHLRRVHRGAVAQHQARCPRFCKWCGGGLYAIADDVLTCHRGHHFGPTGADLSARQEAA